ncbi:MAG: c-type cytochrome biogenesis protein CcmI/CycH [Acidobacteriota bacterium]
MARTSLLFGPCLLGTLLFLSACSQNEAPWKGPAPEAPRQARAASPVSKEEAAAPEAPPPPPPASTAPAGGAFQGEVVLPDSLKARFVPGSTLFVVARSLGGDGRPVAAQKILPSAFPVAFSLTQADSMMGDPLPAEVDLLVRLDRDGDISTREEGDLSAGPVRARAGSPSVLTLGAP